jgi:Mg-chelatase subunit ChlD
MKTSRTRLISIVFVTFVIAASAVTTVGQSRRVAPTPTPPRDHETERVVTEEIKLNVLAFDEDGKFFSDVTNRDLVITENNILHQPESVRRLPARVLIVMDTGGELRSVKTLDQTRRVARGLVEALRPDDFVSIMTYADKAEIVSEWTDDRARMLAAIRRTSFGRKSVFVDALRLATDFLQRDAIENKHLVLITDGTDSAGRSSAKFDAFQRLLSTDISVHVLSYTALESEDIEPRTKSTSNTPPPRAIPPEIEATLPNGVRKTGVKVGPTINLDRTLIKKMRARQNDLEISQEQLEKLAENTNGEFILPLSTDEMIDKAALVARMIDSSYVVTYTPKVPVVGTRGIAERTIDVTSKRPGLVVQARRKLVVDTSRK